MGKEGKTGVTANTPKHVFFGAGTIHKNLTYTAGQSGAAGSWNFAASCIGATNGGSTLTITPEFYDVPVDGANVAIKDLKVKVGETATLEVNFAELTKDLIVTSTIANADDATDDTTKTVITPKGNLDGTDYWDNIAFVGKTLDGETVIAILENALCTSGLPLAGTNREGATIAATFTCHADIATGGDLDALPWKIYYPKATA
ncbi:hypothetical protein [Bacillus infantis]|uniref:hypothetical protein n=1 Tax=Bacillus infantis TaxID=324767 RepID=UPI003CF26E45